MADISEFYHSIYTHSIPWALHTKPFAKVNRGAGILGNDLDVAIRSSQQGQTMGIPVGPDTSLVIAECVLAAVESLIRVRLPNLTGFRFVDDFELCFRDYAAAEDALAVLQEGLLQYELRLNPRKTGLYLPPISFEPEWVSELRRFKIRDNSGQSGDIVAYFDLMTRYLVAHPNDHVSKYGLTRFKRFNPKPRNLATLQSLLCHVGVAEPGSIREVVESLSSLRRLGFQLDLHSIGETFNTVITNGSPLGYHYEVSWALWGAISFGTGLTVDAISAMQSTENSVVALLALDASQKGLAPNLDTSRWAARMTAQDLREDEWLLSYEARVRNWLPSVGGGDHVATDRDFGYLRNSNVRFYV